MQIIPTMTYIGQPGPLSGIFEGKALLGPFGRDGGFRYLMEIPDTVA
jgi:hypothetical protein